MADNQSGRLDQAKSALTRIHSIAWDAQDGDDIDRPQLLKALEEICTRAGATLRWIADQEPSR